MRQMRFFVCISFVLACVADLLGGVIQHPDTAAMNREIRKVFEARKMSGMGIAVTSGDSVIYSKSFGYRILPSGDNPGEKLEDDDLFKIASVSKTYIATVIMRYLDEGKLTLDSDAQKFLRFPLRNPAYPDKKITIKQLLNHTSGINDNLSWWNIEVINPNVTEEYYKCYSPTAPGEAYKYCNMNYLLLAAVIEGISGKRFDEEVDRIIMRPLKIHGSFRVSHLDTTKFVYLYYKDDKTGEVKLGHDTYKPYKHLVERYELGKSLGLAYPPSGMKITPKDMARYMMMHCNYGELDGERVISRASEQLMQQNYVGKSNYGLSYRQYPDLVPGKVLHGQTGGSHGVKTCMIFEPESRYGFVIFSAGPETDFIDGYGDIHKPLIKILHKYLLTDN